jgi:hypothetical protein
MPPSATLPLRLRVTPLSCVGAGTGHAGHAGLGAVESELVLVDHRGVSIWLRLTTAFCGTMVVL